MTREDVLKLFPDATDEQITNLLNKNNSEVAREKEKAGKYKENADKAEQLQAELDRINEEKLSDIEKANKATETANTRVAELEKQVKTMQTRAQLAEKGIVGEQADKLFREDGSVDFDILGQIISDREAAAATAKEKELASNAGNPGGGSAGGSENEKTTAERIAQKLFSGSEQKTDVLSHYLGGN